MLIPAKRNTPKAGPVAGVAAAVLLAVVGLLALFAGATAASAQNTLVAIDVGDVAGNSGTSLGDVNRCLEVAPEQEYTLDVVILDVQDLVAAQVTLQYDGTVLSRSVDGSILNEESPSAGDAIIEEGASDRAPDPSGQHQVLMTNDAAIGSGGASGSGMLIRFQMKAPAATGLHKLDVPDTPRVLVTSQAQQITHSAQDAVLAVSISCSEAKLEPPRTQAPPGTTPEPTAPGGSPGTTIGPDGSPGASPGPGATGGASGTGSPGAGNNNASNGNNSAANGNGDDGLPLGAWIGIGLAVAALAAGAATLALNPDLRRRLFRR